MGVLPKGFGPALHRFGAIKVMAAAVAGSATARKRFTREAQAAAAVFHDHVVTVHGVHEADGLPYLVMQYVAGESLQARIDRTGPLDVVEIVRIGMQTAAGLAAAHAQGLIHRDIKPANLLLENGLARVKITDFGLARMVDDVGLTQAGVVAGTPEYMAPEQARGEAVDHRADLFSLGSVLYAMCTGMPPFRGSSAVAVLRRVSDEEPKPVRPLNPDVPAWLEAVITRLMAKDPADRFQSAAEVAALLEGYLAHLRQPTLITAPELPPSPAQPQREGSDPDLRIGVASWFRRPRRLTVLVLVAVVGLVSSVVLLGTTTQEGPRPAQEFFYDFRGGRQPPPCFMPLGPDAHDLVRPEAKGLRITLPADRPQTDPVGLELTSTIKGHCEITVGYEILQAERPKAGYGVGFEFFVETATPTREGLGLYRVVRAKEGEVYMVSRNTTENGKRQYKQKYVPAASRSGWLRLTRTGTEATLLAAEADSDDFRELCRYDLGAEDLTRVRLTAYVGYDRSAVDVRVLDLRIRADGLVVDQGLDTPMASEAGGPTRSSGWLAAGGIIGLAVLLLLLIPLGVWFRARRGGRAGKAPPQDGPAEGGATGAPLHFRCPACGKNLTAKAGAAGKKVKCPKCRQAVLVPAVKAGRSSS